MPPSSPTGTPPSALYARALAWLQAKGLPLAEAKAALALFPPSEEDAGETEAVFLSTRRPSASQ
jgi:hypothetical protein